MRQPSAALDSDEEDVLIGNEVTYVVVGAANGALHVFDYAHAVGTSSSAAAAKRTAGGPVAAVTGSLSSSVSGRLSSGRLPSLSNGGGTARTAASIGSVAE